MKFLQWLDNVHFRFLKKLSRSAAMRSGQFRRLSLPRPSQAEMLEEKTLLTTLFGLTDTNSLIRFVSDAPGTIEATVTITGLRSGGDHSGHRLPPCKRTTLWPGNRQHARSR